MSNKKTLLESLKEKFEDPEFVKSLNESIARDAEIKERYKNRVTKFHERLKRKEFKFRDFADKVIQKYSSKNYKNKEYKLGYEPRETLFTFIYSLAANYGRECSTKEWNKHSNMFTSDLRFYRGYYVNVMHGQGVAIKVFTA